MSFALANKPPLPDDIAMFGEYSSGRSAWRSRRHSVWTILCGWERM